jgi:hypothetical protein
VVGVKRKPSEVENNVFCSSSCSAIFNNKLKSANNKTTKGKTIKANCIGCLEECDFSIHCSKDSIFCKKCKKKNRKEKRTKVSYCKTCSCEFITQQGKYCETCLSDAFRKAGCKSSATRKDLRRSKNEIAMYDLCKNYFDKVENNLNYFNDWDADILIFDYKIAIHWNGIWHYKECNGWTSLETRKIRDKIRYNEVMRAGWINYIIEDLKSYNLNKVNMEFEKLKEYCEYLKNYIPDYQI